MKFIDKILIWLGKHIASGDNYLYIGSILIQWGSTGYPFTSKTAVNKNITFGKSYASAPLVFTADVSTQNFPHRCLQARQQTKPSVRRLQWQVQDILCNSRSLLIFQSLIKSELQALERMAEKLQRAFRSLALKIQTTIRHSICYLPDISHNESGVIACHS